MYICHCGNRHPHTDECKRLNLQRVTREREDLEHKKKLDANPPFVPNWEVTHIIYTPSQIEMLLMAIRVAVRAHATQTDKSGRPYIEHVFDVMNRCKTFEAKIVGLLHDTIEDTKDAEVPVTKEYLSGIFGQEYAEWVDIVTRKPEVPDEEYYETIALFAVTLEVKEADIGSNTDPKRLATLPPKTQERLVAKYDKAKRLLGLN